MKLNIIDRAIINEIINLIIDDYPCDKAEDKFGRKIEEILSEKGIVVNFNDWIASVDFDV